MANLNIVFMGTPYFAVPTLEALIKNNFNIVAVVTAPDLPAGRGRKLQMSDVKKAALEHQINVLQPTNLKSEDFLNELKQLKVDLQIVVAFRMLPKQVWQLPKYGTFNLHASLLPDYRGAAPINWAVINGDTKSGVSTFFIDNKIDTGALIDQVEIEIKPTDDAGNLHDKLMLIGSKLVVKTVKSISNKTITTKPQSDSKSRLAPKLNPNNCKIDWNKSLTQIHNKIRGLSPYPAAWCLLKQNDETIKLKLFKTTILKETHQNKIGMIKFDKKSLKIACTDGWLNIEELQLAGKRKMDIVSFLNGYQLNDDTIVL